MVVRLGPMKSLNDLVMKASRAHCGVYRISRCAVEEFWNSSAEVFQYEALGMHLTVYRMTHLAVKNDSACDVSVQLEAMNKHAKTTGVKISLLREDAVKPR